MKQSFAVVRPSFVLLVALVAPIASCTAAHLCIAGESEPCTCTDGRMGAQRCTVDGAGFGECLCTGGDDAGPTDDAGPADSGGLEDVPVLADAGEPLDAPTPLDAPAPLDAPPLADAGAARGHVRAMALSGNHTCAVRWDGTVACWGRGMNGELGTGARDAAFSPVDVPGITTAVDIAVGAVHSIALLADGTLRCWGTTSGGACGFVSADSTPLAPTAVPGVTGAVSVESTQGVACALLGDGSAQCWGNDPRLVGGGLPAGPPAPPTRVIALRGAVELALPINGALCARLPTSVFCWGENSHGEIGTGLIGGVTSMIDAPVVGLSDAVGVASGGTFTCAAHATGSVSCWGNETGYRLGNGDQTTLHPTPTPVTGITDAVSVVAGGTVGCALRAGRRVSCWGANSSGEIGDGTTDPAPLPFEVTALTGVVDLVAGGAHHCGIFTDHVACWGLNADGQLGNGSISSSATPVTVTGL